PREALDVSGHAMTTNTIDGHDMARAMSFEDQHSTEIQPYGHLLPLPIGLSEAVCREGVEQLNQLLADTVTLRDLYKKHHWQVLGPTFYHVHLLFDTHSGEQSRLVDKTDERGGDGRTHLLVRAVVRGEQTR